MKNRNLTLMTDLYELTMMQGYFNEDTREVVVFDMFYRKNPCGSGYAIAAGLEQLIDYIQHLQFTYDDITYLRSLGIFSEEFLEYLRGFHFSGDIYGDRVPVRFCRFLWPTQKFGTLEELSAMVGRAAQAAREWREK